MNCVLKIIIDGRASLNVRNSQSRFRSCRFQISLCRQLLLAAIASARTNLEVEVYGVCGCVGAATWCVDPM